MINPAVLATTRNPDKREGIVDHVLQTHSRILKLSTLEMAKFGRKYLRIKSPVINMIQHLGYNVLAQDYTADINLFPRSRWCNPFKLLAQASRTEIQDRMREGELATWERAEMVRNCTSVSRTLDRIVQENGWKSA